MSPDGHLLLRAHHALRAAAGLLRDPHGDLVDVKRLAYRTRSRECEWLAVRWSDVSLELGAVELNGMVVHRRDGTAQRVQSDNARCVFLPKEAVEILERRWRRQAAPLGETPVFAGPDGDYRSLWDLHRRWLDVVRDFRQVHGTLRGRDGELCGCGPRRAAGD